MSRNKVVMLQVIVPIICTTIFYFNCTLKVSTKCKKICQLRHIEESQLLLIIGISHRQNMPLEELRK